jgi:DNA polymerase-3 subunit epsilon
MLMPLYEDLLKVANPKGTVKKLLSKRNELPVSNCKLAGFNINKKINIMTTDFAAIDFETANYNPSSVCSAGVVIVRNGKIADKIYRLIRPEPEWYSYWNTQVHGLTAEDIGSAPVFPFVWKEIATKIAGLPLVAHNSSFDERCLQAVHQVYQMDYPDYEFHCTCRASRRVFGNALTDHQLHTVAAHCGFELKDSPPRVGRRGSMCGNRVNYIVNKNK